jgi:hypothetical protein
MTALEDAWQAALAAEDEAVFGYGLLGPQLSGADRDRAAADAGAHEALRDDTAAAIGAAGLTPVPPLADYPALYPVDDSAAALKLALRLEDGCAGAWRFLYLQAAGSTSARAGRLRGSAQAGLTASAVRGARWRAQVTPAHPSTPFPGLP